METKVMDMKKTISQEDIRRAAKVLRASGLVAFPTETVYGLGANGLDQEACKKIFKAKGRPQDNPLILHIHNLEWVEKLAKNIPQVARACMEKFWPGPLTLLLEKSSMVPDLVTAGLPSVALRMPKDEIALALIGEANLPLAAPSANKSGRPSPTRADHVLEDLDGIIDMVIDGGKTGIGIESTVLDLSGPRPMILRPGAITLEDLREIIPNLDLDPSIISEDEKIVPKSPGQKYKHYAPRAQMILFTGEFEKVTERIREESKAYMERGKKVGVISTEESRHLYKHGLVRVLGRRDDKEEIGRNLFNVIRSFDKEDVDVILSEGVDLSHMGRAIMNRMIKAAGGRIIKL